MNLNNLKEMIQAFEQLILNIECGETLPASLSQMPKIKSNEKIAKDWCKLRNQILKGKISIKAAVSQFKNKYKTIYYCQQLIKEKTQPAIIQNIVLFFVCIIFSLLSKFFFPQAITPNNIEIAISLTIIALGYLLSKLIMKLFTKQLWFADWIVCLSILNAKITCGYTLTQSLIDIEEEVKSLNLPKVLAEYLLKYIHNLRQNKSDPIKPELAKNFSKKIAMEQFHWIQKMNKKGQPMAKILDAYIKSNHELINWNLNTNSAKLNMLILIPLFTFYLPAILYLIIAPIFRTINF